MPYRVVSTPQVTVTTVASPDGQGILTELVNRWIPTPSGGVAMGGGASAQFSFSSSDPPQYFEARQDAGMVIGAVLLNLIGIIINPLGGRSEEHTSELQSLMRISYAVFCLKKKKNKNQRTKAS